MNKDEVLKLAKLARVDMQDAEAEKLSTEFEAILGYVAEVKAASATGDASASQERPALRNVMREDSDAHESGIYTDKILAEAPNSKDGYVVVKKIL
jgi:aspartyl-tRNA(Asn)/glutamyl-tRNA(Gln) amidotransferase subunit C